MKLDGLKIKIFADGANAKTMDEQAKNPLIKGFTTNPKFFEEEGIEDIEGFAREVLEGITDKPVSLPVIADEFPEMERQARKIASWGPNAWPKIPIMNTRGESSCCLIQRLAADGVRVNVTAIFTFPQARDVIEILNPKVPAILSYFAGRVANTLADPNPAIRCIHASTLDLPYEVLWASVRAIGDIRAAMDSHADIITVPAAILKNLPETAEMDLLEYSRRTVEMFYDAGKRYTF